MRIRDEVRREIASGRRHEDDLAALVPGHYTDIRRREAIAVLYRGTSHHNSAQAWLLRRTRGKWRAVSKVTANCTVRIERLPVAGAPDLVLLDESCMHQGYDEGTIPCASTSRPNARSNVTCLARVPNGWCDSGQSIPSRRTFSVRPSRSTSTVSPSTTRTTRPR